MLSHGVTCYVLQRNTASMMNVGFNCAFVSACKVNFSTQLLYGMLLMVKEYLSKVGGTQPQERPRSGRQKAKGWEPVP